MSASKPATAPVTVVNPAVTRVFIGNANTNSTAFDPYAVLGVSRNASPEEIRAAYRREMVNYHPDKVAHLGKELQELAKTKAQEINRATKSLRIPAE